MNRSVRELLGNVELVVDKEGRRKAVLIDYSSWEELLDWIEAMEVSAEIEASRTSGEKTVPWEEAKAELHSKGIKVLGTGPAVTFFAPF